MSATELSTATSSSADAPSPVLETEDLLTAVKRQVEYYFSRENLQSDGYLNSQMDSLQSVAISLVLTFSKMKTLTQDESVVVRALANSTVVTVLDGCRLKAVVKTGGRSTIILRDIPSDAPEEEVRAIFQYEGSKNIVSIRSEIGDTWFVVMESEEDAKDTLVDLKLKKRLFRDQAVKGRMKSESAVPRTFFGVAAVPPPVMYSNMSYPPYGGYGFGLMGVPPLPGQPLGASLPPPPQPPVLTTDNLPGAKVESGGEAAAVSVDGAEGRASRVGGRAPAASMASGVPVNVSIAAAAAASGPSRPSTATRDGRDRKTASTGAAAAGSASGSSAVAATGAVVTRSTPASGVAASPSTDRKAANGARAGAATRREAGRGAGTSASSSALNAGSATTPTPTIEISAANFPPLQASEEIPTPGYKSQYHKYSFDDVINIVKNIKDTKLPETVRPEDHPLAMTVHPNMDLLQRQRTFSIDETREQLRQGRPVQREAIVSGSVDYGSMMYGDGYQPDGSQASTAGGTAAAGKAPKAPPAEAKKRAASGSSWAALVKSTAPEGLAAGTVPGAASSSSAAAAKQWTRGEKVGTTSASTPAAAEKTSSARSVGGKSGDTKKGNAPTAGGGDKDKKKGDRAKKESKKDVPKEKDDRIDAATITGSATSAAEGSIESSSSATAASAAATPAVTSSWGGKPTFANILKLQQEGEVESGIVPVSPAKSPGVVITAQRSSTSSAPKDHGESKDRRGRSGSGGGGEKDRRRPAQNKDREGRGSRAPKEAASKN